MSSNINKSALELEQFNWVMAKTCNETHLLLSGKASGPCRIKPGDNHEIFYHYRHSCIGGSQGKISSQRQVKQPEGQEKTGAQGTT